MSDPPADAERTAASPFDGASRAARIIGEFVAPTTLLTALLFYFGRNHANWFFLYFGVDPSVLGLTVTDYLVRSVDALWVPLMTFAVIVVALMWGYLLLPQWIRTHGRSRWARIGIAVPAVVVALNGLSGIFWTTPLNRGFLVAHLCTLIGTVVLWSVVVALRRDRRERDPSAPVRSEAALLTEWAVLFAIVGLTLFALATDYSAAVGKTQARRVAAHLGKEPNVVVYSDKDLFLASNDVRKVECGNRAGSEPAYRFRYDGLVLLLHVGNQHVLLPRTWTPRSGAAIVLPGSSGVRFEFRAPTDPPPATC
ncbi:hypothetical protein IU479_21925 [Nocardia abscessus]|uniref:hypothetical protein n=1 Tax=Nocardia TaxID=1817 RepID=UPI0018941B00|nr:MULTISPECIES: hypothetical protein [Nocardia]MBF6220765.1 hypothetical protein [Nocardia abscessus]